MSKRATSREDSQPVAPRGWANKLRSQTKEKQSSQLLHNQFPHEYHDTFNGVAADRRLSLAISRIFFSLPLRCISSLRKHAYIVLTPLNPTFIQWNWGLQGYTSFFLFLLKNIDCGYSLEPPLAVLTNNHNLCFEQKYEKYQIFFNWEYSFFGCKIFNIFE